jgi:hypothetical protein
MTSKMNAKIDKIKIHFQENKKSYAIAGSCLVIGAAISAIVLLIVSKQSKSGPQIVFNNEVNPVFINLLERSTPSKPVHLVGTNLYFNSLNEAARETGCSLTQISKNVNGIIPNVKGDVFELLERV